MLSLLVSVVWISDEMVFDNFVGCSAACSLLPNAFFITSNVPVCFRSWPCFKKKNYFFFNFVFVSFNILVSNKKKIILIYLK